MQCQKCGNELSQGSVYCGKCGSKVEEPVVEASVSSSETSAFSPVQEAAPAPQPVAQPVQVPVGYAPAQAQSVSNPYARPEAGVSYTAHSQTPHQGQPSMPVQRGCLGTAFHDIISSPVMSHL